MYRVFRVIFIPTLIIEIAALLYFLPSLVLNTPVALLTIKTESMLPLIKPGDKVLIQGWEKHGLRGQVIAFYDPLKGLIMVHRVIEENKDCFITKGDNSQDIDFFQPCQGNILGKVMIKI